MTFIEALFLALALCVDSLVVSATATLSIRPRWQRGTLMAIVFGLCQAAFPLMGALVGDVARSLVEAAGHWVAFGLLALVGGKMVADGLRGEEHTMGGRSLTLWTMLLLGVATSIDSFAVGIGLGLEYAMGTVWWVVLTIGGVTTLVALLGYFLGSRRIPVPERTATIIAGVVLIGLGVKILLDHLLAV